MRLGVKLRRVDRSGPFRLNIKVPEPLKFCLRSNLRWEVCAWSTQASRFTWLDVVLGKHDSFSWSGLKSHALWALKSISRNSEGWDMGKNPLRVICCKWLQMRAPCIIWKIITVDPFGTKNVKTGSIPSFPSVRIPILVQSEVWVRISWSGYYKCGP